MTDTEHTLKAFTEKLSKIEQVINNDDKARFPYVVQELKDMINPLEWDAGGTNILWKGCDYVKATLVGGYWNHDSFAIGKYIITGFLSEIVQKEKEKEKKND